MAGRSDLRLELTHFVAIIVNRKIVLFWHNANNNLHCIRGNMSSPGSTPPPSSPISVSAMQMIHLPSQVPYTKVFIRVCSRDSGSNVPPVNRFSRPKLRKSRATKGFLTTCIQSSRERFQAIQGGISSFRTRKSVLCEMPGLLQSGQRSVQFGRELHKNDTTTLYETDGCNSPAKCRVKRPRTAALAAFAKPHRKGDLSPCNSSCSLTKPASSYSADSAAAGLMRIPICPVPDPFELSDRGKNMTLQAKTATLAIAAGVLIFVYRPLAFAQQQLTDRDKATIANNEMRHFGDAPENPGPIATDLSYSIKPKAVAKAMRKVADWQLERAQPYFDRLWTWSALYTGFMAASDSLGDPKYRDAMMAMGQKFDWKLRARMPNADDHERGPGLSGLLSAEERPGHVEAHQTELDAILAAPRGSTVPGKEIAWWWCDALFMAPPVWARMYAATGDRKYIDYLDRGVGQDFRPSLGHQRAPLCAGYLLTSPGPRPTERRCSGRAEMDG